jgi:hypothetical protein
MPFLTLELGCQHFPNAQLHFVVVIGFVEKLVGSYFIALRPLLYDVSGGFSGFLLLFLRKEQRESQR